MKKKSLISIILILIFTISTLGILLTQNNPITPPINTPNHPNPATKTYTGTGDQLNATLQVANNINTTSEPTDVETDFYLNCPQNWNLTYAQINLTDITAPNHIKIIELGEHPSNRDITFTRAMSFNLTNNAYLDTVSVYLKVLASVDVIVGVYNSTTDGKPSTPLGNSIKTVGVTSGYEWVNFTFNHIPLKLNETYSNKFFIIVGYLLPQGPDEAYWGVIDDSPGTDEGDFYYYSNNWWYWQGVDAKMVVNVSASYDADYEEPFPSEIDLRINGTIVEDVSKGEGYCILSDSTLSSTGSIFFNITSTWMETVTLTIDFRNTTFVKQTSATTIFVVGGDSGVFWNITVEATGVDGFPTSNGANYITVSGIPPDWGDTTSMVYNQTGGVWIALASHPPNDVTFPASNGTWIVNCTAPNYVSGISFGVGGEPVENATLYDFLDISVTFNTSLRSNVTGDVELNIYDFNQILNYTRGMHVDEATGTLLSWNVGDNATFPGTYNVTVSFHNGFVVGYNESQLQIVALASSQLDVAWYPEHYEYPGPVPVIISYYNKTNPSQGIAGASISAYFENDTPITIPTPTDYGNGSYLVQLNFGTGFGDHRVYFNASKRLFEPGTSSTILINYTKVLVSIVLYTPQSVVLNTPLVATATLRFSNNSAFVGQTVNFNFSLRFANGSSTVIQLVDNTNYEGRAEASIVVPLDTVELNVTAFYNSTETVSGATSSTNSVTLTGGVVSPNLVGLFSLMFLVVAQQGQNFTFYLLIGAAAGSVVVAGVAADRVRRRRLVPLRALASLENIIVDHIPTGATLWSFDFLKMEQDVTLVSGFMSAVKSFMGEMQKGGLRKLETELGTFIREDGDFLTATCITCGNTPQEEEWIRRKLRSFLAEAETQHLDLLENWRGDVQPFRDSLPLILASVIDLDKAEKLLRERISRLQKSKEKLQVELNRLGSQLEDLAKQVEAGKISESKFEAARVKIEPKYDEVQKEYIHTSLCLSRVPPRLEAKPTPEVAKEVEKIQDRFLKIRMEIDGLRRKELDGTITSQDIKRRDKLHKELLKLIERLDKLQK